MENQWKLEICGWWGIAVFLVLSCWLLICITILFLPPQLSFFDVQYHRYSITSIILKICESNNSLYSITFILGIFHYQKHLFCILGLWGRSICVFRWFVIRETAICIIYFLIYNWNKSQDYDYESGILIIGSPQSNINNVPDSILVTAITKLRN
jgi:hypothetical protein